jgi:hypothetical protein
MPAPKEPEKALMGLVMMFSQSRWARFLDVESELGKEVDLENFVPGLHGSVYLEPEEGTHPVTLHVFLKGGPKEDVVRVALYNNATCIKAGSKDERVLSMAEQVVKDVAGNSYLNGEQKYVALVQGIAAGYSNIEF